MTDTTLPASPFLAKLARLPGAEDAVKAYVVNAALLYPTLDERAAQDDLAALVRGLSDDDLRQELNMRTIEHLAAYGSYRNGELEEADHRRAVLALGVVALECLRRLYQVWQPARQVGASPSPTA